MNTPIRTLEIHNFKSIKELKLETKRINLFIGKPNAGKSNILEALSVFNLDQVQNDKGFKKLVRYEKISDLFHAQDMNESIRVLTNVADVYLKYYQSDGKTVVVLSTAGIVKNNFRDFDKTRNVSEVEQRFNKMPRRQNGLDAQGLPLIPPALVLTRNGSVQIDEREGDFVSIYEEGQMRIPKIKPYKFKTSQFENLRQNSSELLSPNGENIFTVLELHPELRKEVAGFFKEYGLQFVMNKSEKKILIQQQLDNEVIQYPYSTIADTLQRIIFYLAAVKTNRDSVIVLEEPEAHSYPPYTQVLAQAIAESKENQFFIATHSPYLLDTIIEECTQDEVAVFITTFENFETKIYPQDDLGDVLDYGASVFFNLEKLITKKSLA